MPNQLAIALAAVQQLPEPAAAATPQPGGKPRKPFRRRHYPKAPAGKRWQGTGDGTARLVKAVPAIAPNKAETERLAAAQAGAAKLARREIAKLAATVARLAAAKPYQRQGSARDAIMALQRIREAAGYLVSQYPAPEI